MKIRTQKYPSGMYPFINKFYSSKFKKEELIEWLVDLEVAPREVLEKMSLPLIYCTFPDDCESALNEELEAIHENEGR